MDIKDRLQKFFDKPISTISEKNGFYYVTLDDGNFVKDIYEIDIKGTKIIKVGINPLIFDKEYNLIWSKEE